jgi:FAD/FMN-containing dehydrogenase
VELQLKPVAGPLIDSEQIRFATLDEFFELSADSDKTCEYTVAWVDCVSGGSKLGRGIFIRGNHSTTPGPEPKTASDSAGISLNAPEFLINRASMRVFNSLYFHAQRKNAVKRVVPYDKFFYPLDVLPGWNRLYGRRGFLQYQFVVPFERRHVLRDVLRQIERSGQACTLSVLKVFGDVQSPGMLSFPRPGATFALDFPMQGQSTLDLCDSFDEMVRQNGGAVYPAKDARMSASSFQTYFPRWKEFLQFRDPQFSSNLWRRVTAAS